MIDVSFCRTIFMLYNPRVSNNYTVIRNIKVHKRIRCDHNIIANMNRSNYGGIDTYPYMVSYHRSTLTLSPILLSDCYPLVYVAIITNHYFWIYRNAKSMTNVTPPPPRLLFTDNRMALLFLSLKKRYLYKSRKNPPCCAFLKKY